MKIKYIHVKNFKSFDDEIINLDKLNIILGANASGKSNLISIFRFITNIIQYGLDDAISLLGGIDYTTNATIGKTSSIYINFILDVADEKWIRSFDRKKGRALWVELIECEFEIVPHKRGAGYRIEKEKMRISYRSCELANVDNHKEYKRTTNEYIITFIKKGNKLRTEISDNTGYDDEQLKEGLDANFFKRVIEEVSKERKELMLYRLDYMMPPMFNFNDFIKVYDFDPKLMKNSSSITSKRGLEEDGANIANVLQSILKRTGEKKKLLDLLQDSLPFVESIDIQNNVDKSVSYKIKEKYNKKTFYSNFLSDGTVNMLALILALYFDNGAGITIIEEPERNLHPQLMSKIIEMAKEVSGGKTNYYYYT